MSRDSDRDTIVAIATPPGRGALAIVRLSGPGTIEVARRVIDPWPLAPRRASLRNILDSAGEKIDRGVVVLYEAPASFTGEHAVEVSCHGGAVTPALIAAAFVAAGARPAEPGEFTRRAVLNGQLDLLQAEAIGDLVDAATRASHRVALSQLDGGLSRRITRLREEILALEALAAYDIDFPEEDDGPVSPQRVLDACAGVLSAVDGLLATAPVGELVREGAVVVIAGAPNVGKSSLFNALLGRRRAIVTELPGTTRDALEAVTEAGVWPIRLVDTAGLRDTVEVVEQLGIEVSREYLGQADVVLVCGDSAQSLDDARAAVATLSTSATVEVWTKADLIQKPASKTTRAIAVSAETGAGLAELRRAISDALDSANGAVSFDAPLVTRERQRFALEQARAELQQFYDAFREKSLPAVVATVHLREATRFLEELIGAVDVEDVLDRVFSSFCVGK